jgi:tRNA A-37 threonylcarbamoyl transferase component Bud32
MADLQLHIEYKSLPNRVLMSAMTILFPVWAIFVPATLGLFIGNIIKNPAETPLYVTILGCISLIAILLVFLGLTAYAEDKYINVSKNGIAFPLSFLRRLRAGRNRGWTDLTNIELIEYGQNNKSNLIALGFNSGELVPLKIACLNKQDLEQLLMAIELWATNCKRSPELITYQHDLQNSHSDNKKGYTQMWEEELGRRFTNTVFIPLEPDNALQNGRFKIVRQLAFGGLSAIYLAQMNDLDLVVLKEAVVPKDADKQKQEEAEEHLVREAKLLTQLDHANITHVLDHFFEDGRHYLVLQYLNGQDLRQYVKQNGPVPQEKTIEWAITISDVLTYLHSQQPPIIHRDLTPDNLILTNKGDIVLIDFGAANQFLGAATGTIIGKQAYIPAEQLRGKAVLQSDIYALGCTINYLLTGQDPLPLATAHPKSILDNTDPALDQIVAKCTAFEPEGRYQDIAEVGRALKDLSSKEFII